MDTLKGNGIIITRTKREGTTAWWWISNEKQLPKTQSPTYIHREVIKAAGGRWSRKRRQWYIIANALPASIRALVEDTPSSPPAAPIVFMPDGKTLSRSTVQELIAQGMATVTWQQRYRRTVALGEWLLHSDGLNKYREVRRLTAADRQAAALQAAQAQVDCYLKWMAIVDKWQTRLAVPALPEPDENQPKVQVLASLDDPWS